MREVTGNNSGGRFTRFISQGSTAALDSSQRMSARKLIINDILVSLEPFLDDYSPAVDRTNKS